MKVAVSYENGKVFQHFGKTEQFKVYEITDNNIISTCMVESDDQGHIALANLVKNHDIDVIICGGIGPGAQQALTEAGIRFFSGISGDVEEAVQRFLAHSLEPSPISKAMGDDSVQQGCGHNCSGHCSGGDCDGGDCGSKSCH